MSVKPDKWDLEVDLVAVGSGLGAMSSAIITHDLGGSTVVLEKAPKLGGISAYSGGQCFLHNNHKMKEAGMPDSDELGRQYMDFLKGGEGFCVPEMHEKLLNTAPDVFVYFEEKAGVKWTCLKDFPDYYYPHVPGTVKEGRYLETELFTGSELGEWQDKTYLSPIMLSGSTCEDFLNWGGTCGILNWDFQKIAENTGKDLRGFGPGMMAYFVKAAVVDRKIPAYVNTPVRELVVEDGAVIGVRAEKDGKDFFVKANKGVMLAIGGYDHNEEMGRYFEDLPELKSMCQPFVHGDNIVMGGEIGAALASVPPGNLGLFFGFNIPGEEHDGAPLFRASNMGGCPHAIWVNREGKRFCDEAFYKDYQPRARSWDGVKNEMVNYPPIHIFDQNYKDKYSVGSYTPGDDIPDTVVCKADTLEELAEMLGINGKNLVATVERFNKFAEEGVDHDFGRGEYPWGHKMSGDINFKNPNMGPLNKAPYYGMKLVPVNCGINATGLKTNEFAQVIHLRGNPIKGLYAAGNSAAQLDIGSGYQSGIANTRGLVWGYIAAHHAIKGE